MNQFVNLLFISNGGWAATVLRIPTGIVLAAHGSQKLFGWFGGYGLEGTGQFMASLGLEPGYLMALLAGSAEFFGGAGLLLGFLTRPAAAVAGLTMLVALFAAHWGKGFFMATHGIEYALVLTTICASLALMGGGNLAIDRVLERKFLTE